MLPDGDAPRFEERPVADVEAVSQGRPQVDAAPDDTAADTAQGAPVVATDQPVLPGLKPVLELLASDPARIDTVFIRRGRRTPDTDRLMDLCREMRVRFSLVEGQVLDKLYAGGHQGVVARLFEAGYVELDDLLRDAPDAPLPLIIALDQVQDPGNAGTLARSLYALGGAGLIVPRHNAAYLGAGAHRAAAGALEKLPVARVANLARALDEAAEAGYAIYGAMCGEGSVNAFTATLRTPCVLVLGNEDKGIRPNVAKRCDTLLHIPMLRDFDSFNVAQAGALLLGCFAAPLLRDR
jgi:23S rRNA (guanosine2251-2'-O)-methyltransferase